MKMITLLTLVVFALGCNWLLHSDTVKPFIPGTYSAAWKTPFSESRDTLLIDPVTENGSEGFLITRRTQLLFTNAAKKRAPEYSITKWTGSYNATDKTLLINGNGRILSFDPAGKTMRMGVIIYKKL